MFWQFGGFWGTSSPLRKCVRNIAKHTVWASLRGREMFLLKLPGASQTLRFTMFLFTFRCNQNNVSPKVVWNALNCKFIKNIEKRTVWEIPKASTKASRCLQTLYFTTFFAPPAPPKMCQINASLVKCNSKRDPGVKTIVFCSVWHLPKWAIWTMPGSRAKAWGPCCTFKSC